ncbi:MAG: GAF domain-containing protein [Anaerolineales bacterium]|nr:GAF domain-containing protein [Anaerolineales bacterium]NUQ85037.1 GAF domain-containing protein [Anaerolineales bacterium]
MIWKFFSPPPFEDENDRFRAKVINGFAWATILLLALAMIPYLIRSTSDFTVPILSALIVVMIIALYLLRQGKVNASGLTIIVLGWLGLGIQAYTADGVRDVIIIAYIALGLLASIIIHWRAGSLVILSSIGVGWALALLEVNGLFVPRPQNPVVFARDLTFIFLVITALIYLDTTSLRDAVARANKSEKSLRAANRELRELNQSLEDRIASRTAELELANQRNEKRAKQFEAIAQLAHATASNENLETLLPRLASLISEQFGFYHTGIFLLDEKREYAVLRAANSEGGKRMLARGHKLQVGQTGIVGYVAAVGAPRIALDVGADAAYFDNPELPNTRSEMALPLRVGDEIIGVLDAQSIVSNAFQEEDIEVLSTLADQVAIAIQNARTYERMQGLIREAQRVSGAYLREAWRVLQTDETNVGYRIAGDEISPLTRPLTAAHVKKAVRDGRTVTESGKVAVLAIPIRLRDEVIGVMDIRTTAEHEWDEDEVDIAEAVVDRLSLALETSLLLKSTQRRAEIERITADISGKIGETTQFDSILRTAAEELSRALGGSEVLVQIQPLD